MSTPVMTTAKYWDDQTALCGYCLKGLRATTVLRNPKHIYDVGQLLECPCGKSKVWTNAIRNVKRFIDYEEGRADSHAGFCNDLFCGFTFEPLHRPLKTGVEVPGRVERADLWGNASHPTNNKIYRFQTADTAGEIENWFAERLDKVVKLFAGADASTVNQGHSMTEAAVSWQPLVNDLHAGPAQELLRGWAEDWTYGGCLVLARILQRELAADIYAAVIDTPYVTLASHFVVKYGAAYIDANGANSKKSLLDDVRHLNRGEGLPASSFKLVKFDEDAVDYRDTVDIDDPRVDVAAITAIIRDALVKCGLAVNRSADAALLEHAALTILANESPEPVRPLSFLSMMTFEQELDAASPDVATSDGADTNKVSFTKIDGARYMKALSSNKLRGFVGLQYKSDLSGLKFYTVTLDDEPTEIYMAVADDGEITGIINNGPHKGLALPAATKLAKETSGAWLNCWSVEGRLVNYYTKNGWRIEKSVTYDASKYGEPPDETKKAWELAGWSPGGSYPDVVYMTAEAAILERAAQRIEGAAVLSLKEAESGYDVLQYGSLLDQAAFLLDRSHYGKVTYMTTTAKTSHKIQITADMNAADRMAAEFVNEGSELVAEEETARARYGDEYLAAMGADQDPSAHQIDMSDPEQNMEESVRTPAEQMRLALNTLESEFSIADGELITADDVEKLRELTAQIRKLVEAFESRSAAYRVENEDKPRSGDD